MLLVEPRLHPPQLVVVSGPASRVEVVSQPRPLATRELGHGLLPCGDLEKLLLQVNYLCVLDLHPLVVVLLDHLDLAEFELGLLQLVAGVAVLGV